MPVEFRCASARGRAYAPGLRADAGRLMRAAGLPNCELSLILTHDRAIRALNRKFRGKDAATDVLSFSQIEEAGKRRPNPRTVRDHAGLPLGDIVISVDTALAQAREYRVTPRERIRTLLVHGFLHLLGYDHERSAADARKMSARERALAARMRRATR
ncbi:MAG TPA: rRNA maturation RNase YbeY [Candidatus Binataceae bacterium]|nr:rRNA maturation RNase YbeY [Candidatus Binataceae bacterium]